MVTLLDNQKELRAIKNAIIGNLDNKDALSEGEITKILQCLDATYDTPTRCEAANVLYSLSGGSQQSSAALLKHKAHLSLLSTLPGLPSAPPRLKTALGRALRALLQSLADLSSPALYGLLPSVPSQIRKQAQFALEELFQLSSLDVMLPLLNDSSFFPYLASAIGMSVRTPAHRTAMCEWLPVSERSKQKSKRGWEKLSTPLSPSAPSFSKTPLSPSGPSFAHHPSGGVIHILLTHTFDPEQNTQNVATSLDALAAVCCESPSACATLRSELHTSPSTSNDGQALQPLLLLLRSPSAEVRVASAGLLANLLKVALSPSHLVPATTLSSVPRIGHPIGGPSSGILPPGAQGNATANTQACLTLVHALLATIRSDDDSLAIQSKACFILSRLFQDDRHITEIALECGALQALFTALERSSTRPLTKSTNEDEPSMSMDTGEEEEEEESTEELTLREAAFTALSTLSLSDPSYARQILELDASRGQTPHLHSSNPHSQRTSLINPHPSSIGSEPILFTLLERSIASHSLESRFLGVRYSSLQLVRGLCRALGILRTSLADSGVPKRVEEVLQRVAKADRKLPQDGTKMDVIVGEKIDEEQETTEHRAVVIAALMALCNLLNDFAPFRETVIASPTLPALIHLTSWTDDDIRLNAIWAIKNALFNAKHAEIKKIMETLGWDRLIELSEDPDRRIREQSITILQNVTTTNQDITYVAENLGDERLLAVLQRAMGSNDARGVEQAIRAMTNISTSLPHRDTLLLSKPLMALLRSHLTHSLPTVRRAAVECICELLDRRPWRHKELREAGVEAALRAVIGGRERTSSGINVLISPVGTSNGPPSAGLSSASGFGAALGSTGSFPPPLTAGSTARPRRESDVMMAESPVIAAAMGPGLMGRENDREVLTAVKFALLLFERGRE